LLAPAGNNYLWSTAESTQRIAAKEAGSYSVTVTDTHSCTAASNIITITANELPAVPEVTRSGDTLTSTSADSYQWYLDSSEIAGATNQQYVVMQNGNYLVEVTDNNGCSSRSALFNAIDVNVEDVSEELGVKLYPNPNNGEFVVEFTGDEEHELEITDAVGRIFFSAVIADKRKQMNINQMAPGSYLLNIKQYGQTRCFKLSLVK
ncbi:MAG TPA: T9SS type A sorting domain-containing protein, partial [Chitinophagales bacterium]|nr:T9SS type A sorting domain-containing protein [Chitinophagales bacterium]